MSADPTLFHPGQLVMVDIPGTRLDADTAAFLRQQHIRAVCLFRKNLGTESEVRALLAALHQVLGPRALIAIDQEGGSVVRATFLPQAPAAMALGAAGDAALAQAVGAGVARGLRALGINWNFAPVLDVNNNPANPVIAERSFGEAPQAVAQLAAAWQRGALGEGVASCAKHFPGHGDTHTDSHHALPVVDKPLAALLALELQPFAALAQGADAAPAVMTAHIVYPQLDPEHPATLSRTVLHGLLRERLGYQGVVITDALFMQAVYQRYGHARAAVLALAAGADMPLAQGSRADQAAAVQAVGQALADGRLALADLQRSAARLDALAARFPVSPGPYEGAVRVADDALMRRAWAAGLTAVAGATPPPPGAALRIVTQAAMPSDGVSEAGIDADAVRALFDGFADVELLRLPSLDRLSAACFPRDGRFNILVSNHHARYPASAADARPDLHLVLWNPYQAADIAAPALISWGHADGALAALKAWLQGRAGAPGRLPIALAMRPPA